MNGTLIRLRYLFTSKLKLGWGTKLFTRLNYWLLVKLGFTFFSFSLIFSNKIITYKPKLFQMVGIYHKINNSLAMS